MRTWRGTGIISTMRSTKTWDCRWGVEWAREGVEGSSNSAYLEWGCAGGRTDLTICCTSDSPGSTARLRRCFRDSSNHPPTRNYAHTQMRYQRQIGKFNVVAVCSQDLEEQVRGLLTKLDELNEIGPAIQ